MNLTLGSFNLSRNPSIAVPINTFSQALTELLETAANATIKLGSSTNYNESVNATANDEPVL